MASRCKMWCPLVLTGLFAAGVQAFAPSRLEWAASHGMNSVVAFQGLPKMTSFTNLALPQKLALWDRTRTTPESIPHFSVNLNKTITWDGLCLEASGHQVGDGIRVNHCTHQPNQLWNVLASGNEYQLIQLQNTNMCIAVGVITGGLIPLNVLPLELQECAQSMAEAFKFDSKALPQWTTDPSEHHVTFTVRDVLICTLLVALGAVGLSAVLRRLQKHIATSQRDVLGGLDEGAVSLVVPSAAPRVTLAVMAVTPQYFAEEELTDCSILEVGRRSILNPPECLPPIHVPGSATIRNVFQAFAAPSRWIRKRREHAETNADEEASTTDNGGTEKDGEIMKKLDVAKTAAEDARRLIAKVDSALAKNLEEDTQGDVFEKATQQESGETMEEMQDAREPIDLAKQETGAGEGAHSKENADTEIEEECLKELDAATEAYEDSARKFAEIDGELLDCSLLKREVGRRAILNPPECDPMGGVPPLRIPGTEITRTVFRALAAPFKRRSLRNAEESAEDDGESVEEGLQREPAVKSGAENESENETAGQTAYSENMLPEEGAEKINAKEIH